MCGRFELKKTDKLYKRFKLANRLPRLSDRGNISPTSEIPAIITDNHIQFMVWGFQSEWGGKKHNLFNAKGETVDELNSFKKSFQERRCIIPASGFYEWDHTTTPHTPHYIHLKHDPLFGFAGIYREHHLEDGKKVLECSIITTRPNSFMEKIHNRMPVILKKEDEEDWLNPDNNEHLDRLKDLLVPYPAKEMEEEVIKKL